MSLFQCARCGCVENTALSACGHLGMEEFFDWSDMEEWKGKQLCSACSPIRHSDGTSVRKGGKWHDRFDRVFLPLGMFVTNKQGNLEHIETKDTGYMKYALRIEPIKE